METVMPDAEMPALSIETKGVTGRDGYIIAEALVLAMRSIEAMPDNLRPTADQRDILSILNTVFPTWEDTFGPA